ncbi:MAG TPA: aminotransferase class V-fold PLP-dependent enzyme [Pyrinomonadaceae bacterium]|nr:aminotransferase class V-fold PLP-dependent enzyme [Pyrinomonadaceae bacterium]
MSTESLRDQHENLGRAVTRLISEHAARLDAAPVTSRATPDDLKQLFDEPLPQPGMTADEILDQFARDIAPHAMQVPSPHYFGQFNPTPLAIGVWADALCSSLNQNAGAWRNGPTSAMIESQVIRWLCELIGYEDEAFGVLASGGSEANLIALKCARDRADAGIARHGARTSECELTVYTSEQCHFSVEKSLDILGLGRESLHKIETDERYHVRLDCLRESIKHDLEAGRRPFCIVGVAGTTSTGVIDNLPELAAIAREHECWFHVDAAYGGTLAFSDKHQSKLAGIELANSITFDPHKWMFVPFSCGATLVRDGGQVLRDSFDMSPEYLSEDRGFADAEYDFFRYGQMGTRRFISLKLWMCMKFMGRRGYAATTERHIELTEYLAARLDELPDFERIGEVETAVCCFRYLPPPVRALAPAEQDRVQQDLQQRVERSGKAFFPSTVLHGRRALRVNINSYLTERRHVDDLVELLRQESEELLCRLNEDSQT